MAQRPQGRAVGEVKTCQKWQRIGVKGLFCLFNVHCFCEVLLFFCSMCLFYTFLIVFFQCGLCVAFDVFCLAFCLFVGAICCLFVFKCFCLRSIFAIALMEKVWFSVLGFGSFLVLFFGSMVLFWCWCVCLL